MTATAATHAATDYDAFAPHYDAFTSGSDYERWAEVVLEHLRAHGFEGRTLLDVACGTGSSFMPFVKRGFEVSGCDSSPAMLVEAARKAPSANLMVADMRDLQVLGGFELVTCFDDSLNYLTSERDLLATFRSMAPNLVTGGLVVFDLNTLRAYRTTFARDSVRDSHDGRVFAWRGGPSECAEAGCSAEARIDVFIPLAGGSYERVRSRHSQRHFPRDRVAALLGEAGLELIAVSGVLDDGTLVPDSDELRQLKVLYTARRAKGGAPR